MTDKEKIRAAIEKRYNYHKDNADDWAGAEHFWKADEDRDILSFIDSLQEEPVSEDLEEAAKHYLYSNILYDDVYVGNPTDKDCIEMFKAGAQWQLNKIRKENGIVLTI